MVRIEIRKVDKNFIEDNLSQMTAGLYISRRERIEKMSNIDAICTSITAGYLLQDVVKMELNLDANDICEDVNEYGKPYLKGYEKFAYNISHSGGMVAIAYENNYEPAKLPEAGVASEQKKKSEIENVKSLGIDIEVIKKADLRLAEKYFCKSELDYIKGALDTDNFEKDSEKDSEMKIARKFFNIWTMKESYLKCIGLGINVPLDSFAVDPVGCGVSPAVSKRMTDGEMEGYSILKYDGIIFENYDFGDYVLSLCVQR